MMNMPQGAPVDPVSRNPVPPGAMPKEVRDDVDIKASEGEFIVPADVVRFLGLEKLEGLVNKAKESLSQMQQNGRIGGKPTGPSGNPMQRPPEPSDIAPPQAMGGSPRPPGMAEGGVVAQPTTGASQPTMMAYSGPDGRTVYIPFVNGQPLTPIPAGYQPMSQARQAVQPNRPSNSGGTSMLTTPGGNNVNQARGPQEWSVDDFINYGQQLQSGVPDTIMGVVNTLFPLTNIITGLAERNMQATVPGMLDQMIETGMDPQGNPISEEQIQGLTQTREAMADRISQESGSRFNPFESLSNFVGRIVGGGNSPSGQRQSGSMSNPSASQSRSPVAPSQAPASGSSPSSSSSGNFTSTPDKEEKQSTTKTFAYGGLVNKAPVGFKSRAKGMTGVAPQPIIGGQPSGSGFMPPKNQKQPAIGAFDEGGLVHRLPAIGGKPSGRTDQPRGFISRELGQAANEPGRFNADTALQHSYMAELEDSFSHLNEFTASIPGYEGMSSPDRIRKFLNSLTDQEWSDIMGGTDYLDKHDREDLDAARSRTGV